ncbi:MAG: hypothetical protein AAFX78_06450 [Cyanobacteria bacterium J06638_20]
MVPQNSQRVECCRRTSSNTWETAVYEVGDRLLLKSIGLEVAIADLYRGLDD